MDFHRMTILEPAGGIDTDRILKAFCQPHLAPRLPEQAAILVLRGESLGIHGQLGRGVPWVFHVAKKKCIQAQEPHQKNWMCPIHLIWIWSSGFFQVFSSTGRFVKHWTLRSQILVGTRIHCHEKTLVFHNSLRMRVVTPDKGELVFTEGTCFNEHLDILTTVLDIRWQQQDGRSSILLKRSHRMSQVGHGFVTLNLVLMTCWIVYAAISGNYSLDYHLWRAVCSHKATVRCRSWCSTSKHWCPV